MSVRRRALALIAVLTGGLMLAGCETFDLDSIFNQKKPLPGDRRAVFPEGVPGVQQGVPQELTRGYQPPPEPEPEPVAAKPERPKPPPAQRRASAPKPKPQPQPQETAEAPRQAAPPQWGAQQQAPPPAQSPPQSQAAWPEPPRSPQPQQSNTAWPDPPPRR